MNEFLDKIRLFDNKGIHNFSYGVLDSYFRLSEGISKNKVELVTPRVLYLKYCPGGYSPKKVFVYSFDKQDLSIIEELRKQAPIYSIERLPMKGDREFDEVVYDLEKVFSPESYLNSKKRYQRLVYPFTWFQKQKSFEARPLSNCKSSLYLGLHKKWFDKKTEEGEFTHQLPSKRYIRCFEKVISNELGYIGWEYSFEGEIVAIRVLYIQREEAYDLAFFGSYWDCPSQFFNYLEVYGMKILRESFGIRILNCGSTASLKGLKMFKGHYPNNELRSYYYPRVKEEKELCQPVIKTQFSV